MMDFSDVFVQFLLIVITVIAIGVVYVYKVVIMRLSALIVLSSSATF